VIILKNLLPIIIVLALIGGGYYFFTRGGQTGETPSTAEMFQGSLETAIQRGTPLKCEWEDEGVVATTYVKGEMVYTETVTDGVTQYSIYKDNCSWSWNSTGDQAIKFCSDDLDYTGYEADGDMGDYDTGDTGDDEVTETEVPQYNCAPTTVSDSMFEPPADVEFTSF
jgi:hypothetical protein